MKRTLFPLFFLALLFANTLRAQETGCKAPGCQFNGFYNISTGYDHSTSSYLSPTSIEQNWKLTGVPSNASISPNGPSWVIPNSWGSGGPSTLRWVSAFPSSGYSINNWPPSQYDPFTFDNCFCLCENTTVNVTFDMVADDYAEIWLDGTNLGSPGGYFWTYKLHVNQNINLSAGQHCLQVKLYNAGSGLFGFALDGAIAANKILKRECCQTGRICGVKLNDCVGTGDPVSNTGVSGWTINLLDGSGNPIASTVTDGQGNYCFNNLAAGNYTVTESSQPGWIQTYPGGTGTHAITLAAAATATAIFSNCDQRNPPGGCDFRVDLNMTQTDCSVSFNPDYTLIGGQLVNIHWEFDDGTSSDEPYPTHYYTSAGTYKICANVTVYADGQCCIKQICETVKIDKACQGGCDINAKIEYVVTAQKRGCEYAFKGVIISSGAPVNNWHWDFGDGTTADGSMVQHHFPAPGIYHVCLVIFADVVAGDGTHQCCSQTICRDIEVKCDPCKSDGGGVGTANNDPGAQKSATTKQELLKQQGSNPVKESIVLDQNVPNPFAESTVINYKVPVKFSKAQIVFTNAAGKTLKTFNITSAGDGRLQVYADDLSSGTYSYSLIVDGRLIDSKKMFKH